MTCQDVVGKNHWSQRLKLRMRAVKGLQVAARLRWRGRYIVWVHDPLQGQMFHFTGPLSGGQFCQLSPFRTHMQPFVGRVLKARGKSTDWLPPPHPRNCCPKQIVLWNCSLPNNAFVYHSTALWVSVCGQSNWKKMIALPLFQVKPFAFTFSLV